MKTETRSRYESIPKRSFRNGIIRLLEEEFKLIGSHKVIELIADSIIELHKEYYPDIEKLSHGNIVWRTTKATSHKASYGTRSEDYEVKTVILPLITDEDVEHRIKSHYSYRADKGKRNYQKQEQRDIEKIGSLAKSAASQGGWLTGAELSVLMNRSLTTIGRYMRIYHQTHQDILPTKGMMLDQGSVPTHKAAIINLYEQGLPEPDIARLTNHTIESTSRYIKTYKNVKLLLEKKFGIIEIVRVTGLGYRTIYQYREIVNQYHPELGQEEDSKDS